MKNTWLFILAISSFTVSCRNEVKEVKADEILKVRTTPVISARPKIPVQTSGILSTAEEIKLSFKTGGMIHSIGFEEGAKVREGEILASLDLTEIDANVEIARQGLQKAERDYTRADNLYRDSVGTLERQQNAFTALNAARKNYEIALFNRSHSVIAAPENGVILKKLAGSNEMVAPGYPVFLFGISGQQWKVKAGLSERDFVKISAGDSVSASFDAWPGIRFPGRVDQIGEMANPYTGTFETEIILDRTGYRLASGFIGGVEIFPSVTREYSLVPVESVIEADGNAGYIYYVSGSSEARRIKVLIYALTGSFAAVSGVPAEVTEVITEGASYVKEGIKVEVLK